MKRIDFVYRAPGGKTIRVCIDAEGTTAKRIVFTGDFFMDPGEALDELNAMFEDTSLEREEAKRKVEEFFTSRGGIFLLGAAPEDFVKALDRAFQQLEG